MANDMAEEEVTGMEDSAVTTSFASIYQPEAELAGMHQESITSLAFSPTNEQLIVSAGADNHFYIWNILERDTSKRVVWDESGHKGGINDIRWSTDGRMLVSASNDKCLKVWNVERKKKTALRCHQSFVTTATFWDENQRIVSCSHDAITKVWDVRTGLAELQYALHFNAITCVLAHKDGNSILTTGLDGRILCTDIRNNKQMEITNEEVPRIGSDEFSCMGISWMELGESGDLLMHCRADGVIQVVELSTGKILRRIDTPNRKHLHRPCIASAGARERVIVPTDEGSLLVYDLLTTNLIQTVPIHSLYLMTSAAHPTFDIIAAGGTEHRRVYIFRGPSMS